MTEIDLAEKLKTWRRVNGIKQNAVANAIGVSQAAVSRWENGVDLPSIEILQRLTDLIAHGIRDELAIDRRFIERLSSVEAIFDFDGVRLQAASAGLNRLWPGFSRLIGRSFEHRMIGESRVAIDDSDLRKSILRGDVAILVGVSTRHTNLELDTEMRHRWIARFRLDGHRVLATMVYEPCEPETPCGIEDIMRLDDITAR